MKKMLFDIGKKAFVPALTVAFIALLRKFADELENSVNTKADDTKDVSGQS